MNIKNVPAIIRDRITEKGMTIKAVAEKVGIRPQALSAMLRRRQNIPATVFIDLCKVLNLTPENFIDEEKKGE